MSKDECLIHIFAESADQTMSILVMEILSGKPLTIVVLRNKIAETEHSLWYSPNRNMRKDASGAGGPGGPGGAGGSYAPQGRFCKPCGSTTH